MAHVTFRHSGVEGKDAVDLPLHFISFPTFLSKAKHPFSSINPALHRITPDGIDIVDILVDMRYAPSRYEAKSLW